MAISLPGWPASAWPEHPWPSRARRASPLMPIGPARLRRACPGVDVNVGRAGSGACPRRAAPLLLLAPAAWRSLASPPGDQAPAAEKAPTQRLAGRCRSDRRSACGWPWTGPRADGRPGSAAHLSGMIVADGGRHHAGLRASSTSSTTPRMYGRLAAGTRFSGSADPAASRPGSWPPSQAASAMPPETDGQLDIAAGCPPSASTRSTAGISHAAGGPGPGRPGRDRARPQTLRRYPRRLGKRVRSDRRRRGRDARGRRRLHGRFPDA